MPAFVYLIEELPEPDDSCGPWTKIGCTKNPPEWRLYTNIRMGNPRTLHLPAVFEFPDVDGAYAAEAAAHEQFKDRLRQKEWFRVHWTEVANWCAAQGYDARNPTDDQAKPISDPTPPDEPLFSAPR